MTNDPSGRHGRELSEAARRIIAAMEQLLAERTLEQIAVADVMRVAGVARGTFYLWFSSKYDVVVRAHREVIGQIVADAAELLDGDGDVDSIRTGIASFVDTWKVHGPVLAASAEIGRSEPSLHAEWRASMQVLIDQVTAMLGATANVASSGVDPEAVAHALIWMNERSAYMAAAGVAPTGLDTGLVDTLTFVWSAVIGVPPR